MTKTGQMVTLTVAKQAVHYHGLGPLLSPSPQDQSKVTHRRPGSSNQARPKSEGYALQQQGYQPKQIPPASYADRRQPPINDKTKPLALYQNKRKSPINKSTPQLSMYLCVRLLPSLNSGKKADREKRSLEEITRKV